MSHLKNALSKLKNDNPQFDKYDEFIKIETDLKSGFQISFTIQSAPVSEVGVNGLQATDMLEYTKCLFQSLNESYPCRENSLTITKIEEGLHWQESRTKDRIKRNVEGQNKI